MVSVLKLLLLDPAQRGVGKEGKEATSAASVSGRPRGMEYFDSGQRQK